MARLVLFCGVAILIGLGIGFGRHRYKFTAPETFGILGEDAVTTPEDITSYLLSKRPQTEGVPIAEIVGPKDFQFGTMKRGDKGEHAFRVKNTGSATLELRINNSTCKCTVGNLAKNVLAPGEETEVKLAWDVNATSTSFSQSATIGTTDPTHPELSFSINGNVVDDVLFNPGSWTGQQIPSGESQVFVSSAFIYDDDRPFHIVESQWLREQIAQFSECSISEPRPVDPEKEHEHRTAKKAVDVKITVKPGLRQGPLTEIFRIRYYFGNEPKSLEECEVCDLNLHGEVLGNVAIVGGSQLNNAGGTFRYRMGDVPLGEAREAKVFLRLRGDESKQVRASIAKISPEDVLTAEIGEAKALDNSVRIPLTVKLPPQSELVERSGRDRDDYAFVEVKFDREDWAPVKLYLTFRVVDAPTQ